MLLIIRTRSPTSRSLKLSIFLIVAPATANTLAKFANGVADDFLTSTYLACNAPVLVAPAMNTTMWEHPATQRNLEKLRADGVHIIEPDQGEMACGTIGPGRLSEPERIVDGGPEDSAKSERTGGDLAGERILITAGATREPIDPVRFISNRSSGRMGFALAEAARRARSRRSPLSPESTSVDPPIGVARDQVLRPPTRCTARRLNTSADATILLRAAAVADYTPAQSRDRKIKKASRRLSN